MTMQDAAGDSGDAAAESGERAGAPAAATPGWWAATVPDKPAIIMGGSGATVTYAQLEDRSLRFARALRERGLQVGDHIAILMENNRSYLEVAWAAQRAGLYYTAINRHLRVGEVQYVLDDCAARALVTSAAMAEVVAALNLSEVGVRVSVSGAVRGCVAYDQVLAEHQPLPLPDECEGREMLYSSGTTGRPKGVRKTLPMTPLGDPEAAPVQIAQGLAIGTEPLETVYLSPAPLYHAAPLIFSMSWLRLGATVVVMERFDPRHCLELIETHRVTRTQMVPTMFVRLLRLSAEERERYDISSVAEIVHSAAPCPVVVKRQMLDWFGLIVHEYYSGTEDIGTTFITPGEWLEHPGSVGRPMQPCHIVDDEGAELGSGSIGLVYFDGGRPFEYHNDPVKTATTTHPNGWRTLGDIGYLDEDGYLYLTDRHSHMIISGGVNIYPQEAENVLAGHSGIADVAVIGVPDDEMGEEVKAMVQPVDPDSADAAFAAALIAFCRKHLASYKCPRSIDFVDELPRDPNGKLFKRLLRERYWPDRDSLA